tara:strand:+ start:21 stop:1976 length:1956 start_codon:yes stop_codon:yes gene_type:complete
MKNLYYLFILSFLIVSCEEEVPPVTYNLTTQVTPTGSGTVNPSSGTYNQGESISISANPNSEYIFKGWSGSVVSGDNPISFVMDSDKSIIASFEKRLYPLSISIEGQGTVNETSESYESGSKVVLTAVPSEGWKFKEWKGDIISNDNPLEITVSGPISIIAIFEKIGSSITPQELGGLWIFNDYVGGNSAFNINDDNFRDVSYSSHENDGECPVVYLHSLQFDDENYTLNTGNYSIIGRYEIDESSTVSFYENDKIIGTMENTQIDSTTSSLNGDVNFPNILTQDAGIGSPNTDYNENLTYVPEDRFEQYLIDNGWDDELDDFFVTENVKNVTHVNLEATDNCQQGDDFVCDFDEFYDFETRFSDRIKDLSGIEAFENLQHLIIRGNDIDSINLTKNTKLEVLYSNFNSFKGVNTDFNLELRNFSINDNKPRWDNDCDNISTPTDSITKLNVTKNVKLHSYAPTHMNLGSIDVSTLTELKFLDIPGNDLNELDISNNTILEELRVGNNNLTELDITNNPLLEKLRAGSNNLSEIDLSYNIGNLKSLSIGDNKIQIIECCERFPYLEEFSIAGNNISEVDLTKNSKLKELSLVGNPISGTLDVSFMTELWELRVFNTNINCIKLSETQFNKYVAGEYERWALGDTPFSVDCN